MASSSEAETDELADFRYVLHAIIVPVLFAIVTLVGLAGNSLVIYAVLTRVRMRTVTNYLLFNLAIADLCFVLVVPPFTAYEYVAGELPTSSWALGGATCKLLHYLVNVTAYVTVYTLVLVSAVRYMTVVHTVRTARMRTRTNVVIALVALWIIMLILNIPILLSYVVSVDLHGRSDCDLVSQDMGRPIFATFFIFAYVLPLSIIAVFSVLILVHLSKQKTSMLLQQRQQAARSNSRKRQVTTLLVIVVVVFAILWLPIHIHLLVAYFGHVPESSRLYLTMSVIWNCLAYFNSCVNPIIYNHTSKDFRAAFRSVVRCCLCRAVEPWEDDDLLEQRRDVMALGRLQPIVAHTGNVIPIIQMQPIAPDPDIEDADY